MLEEGLQLSVELRLRCIPSGRRLRPQTVHRLNHVLVDCPAEDTTRLDATATVPLKTLSAITLCAGTTKSSPALCIVLFVVVLRMFDILFCDRWFSVH